MVVLHHQEDFLVLHLAALTFHLGSWFILCYFIVLFVCVYDVSESAG